MIASLAIAAGLVWPHRWPEVVPLAFVLLDPRLGALAMLVVGGMAVRGGLDHSGAELAFLSGLAAHLRSGGSLRQAMIEVGTGSDLGIGAAVRLASGGRPMTEVVASLVPQLPRSARQAAMALTAGSLSGGRLASALDAVVQVVFDETELTREVRSATASAKASAWLIGAIPVVGLGILLSGGRLQELASLGTAGWIMVTLGLALLLAGAGLMVSMVRGVQA